MQKDDYSAKTESFLARQEELRRAEERAKEMTEKHGLRRVWTARWAARAVEMTIQRRGVVLFRDDMEDDQGGGSR